MIFGQQKTGRPPESRSLPVRHVDIVLYLVRAKCDTYLSHLLRCAKTVFSAGSVLKKNGYFSHWKTIFFIVKNGNQDIFHFKIAPKGISWKISPSYTYEEWFRAEIYHFVWGFRSDSNWKISRWLAKNIRSCRVLGLTPNFFLEN